MVEDNPFSNNKLDMNSDHKLPPNEALSPMGLGFMV